MHCRRKPGSAFAVCDRGRVECITIKWTDVTLMMVMIACLRNVIVIAAAGLPVRQVLKGRLGRKALRERRVPLAPGERLALPVPAGCQAPRECLGRKACLVPVE